MAKHSKKKPNDFEVGYGKPPKGTQFKKGQSGNPSGRPKKDKVFKAVSRMIREHLLEEIKGSMNGKPDRKSVV